jgi:hypothetical protein
MIQATDITNNEGNEFKYSVCTLVNSQSQYSDMVESFLSHGFTNDDCEYLFIDNSTENRYDAFSGINKFLTLAKGKYIILCHQDLLLISDGRKKLDSILEHLSQLDPNWGICGNAGGKYPSRYVIRITDPYGDDQFTEPLPAKVTALDENFLIVRRDANLAASHDLHGFHLYGADLCAIADFLGYNAYVVDFHLRHLSGGNKGLTYGKIRTDMIAKYGRALRPRMLATSSTLVFLRRRGILGRILNGYIFVGISKRVGWIAWKLGY